MPPCLFASDLHGRKDRYLKLFAAIEAERPGAVFLGGDLLPSGFGLAGSGVGQCEPDDDAGFVRGFLWEHLSRLRTALGASYPAVFAVLGNDDLRVEEEAAREIDGLGLWHYAHNRRAEWDGFWIYGYSCVPPTPFRLKDWERYDVSRFVDPGCCSPEDGWRTVAVDAHDVRYGTIEGDLEALTQGADLSRAILLFHAPPYGTALDRAALDGRFVDHVPLDVHVGSIAIQRFILRRSPLVTLHGHVHESARLTGAWRATVGTTHALSAAHEGPELALVRFDPCCPAEATRTLI